MMMPWGGERLFRMLIPCNCEDLDSWCEKYVDINKFRYIGLGYINMMILVYSTLLPFVYYPTIFPYMDYTQILTHLVIYSHLWVCLVYNYYQMVFSKKDFYSPLLVDQSKTARMHYCSVCKSTVLKRDHHCYFYGICVGYYNLKHFIFIPYWGAVSCAYAFWPFLIYYPIAFDYHPDDYSNLFNDIIRHILLVSVKRKSFFLVVNLALAILASLNVILLPLISIMFLYLSAVNQSTYEYSKGIKKFRRGIHQNLTESLGRKYWLLLFLPWTHEQIDYFSIPSHHID